MTSPLPKILCVDDEPAVLSGLKLNLRKDFELVTAEGGLQALAAIKEQGPFEVLVSDMRMPGMNGAELLSQARKLAPDTIRILLTGQSDMQSAIKAVNEGQLFRFLTKPTERAALVETLTDAVKQHRLICAERELLEKTLRGSIKALTDLLAATSPLVFGRAERIRKLVVLFCDSMKLESRWFIEVAAMVQDIGYVSLPDDVAVRAVQGASLDPKSAAMVANVPRVTCQILQNIPRLDPVIELLESLANTQATQGPRPLGARIIDLCAEFDRLSARGVQREQSIQTILRDTNRFGTDILAFISVLSGGQVNAGKADKLAALNLRAGMVLAADVVTTNGALILSAGSELNAGSIERLRNFASSNRVRDSIDVFIPNLV